jgi:protein TonB
MRKTHIHLLLIAILVIGSKNVFAQAAADTATEKLDKIFTIAEVMPSFKGGDKALNKYLTENVDMQHVQQGEYAYIYFIVSSRGNVYQVQIPNSNISFINVEKSLVAAIEKSSGMWNTGMQNEHHVTAYCKLRITFRHKKIETEIQ